MNSHGLKFEIARPVNSLLLPVNLLLRPRFNVRVTWPLCMMELGTGALLSCLLLSFWPIEFDLIQRS